MHRSSLRGLPALSCPAGPPGLARLRCIEGPAAALSDAMSPKVVDVRSETAVPPRIALTG
ncbi:hypothetical protein ABTX34_32985 [Streptomyces sp. NPDC096538]|uniref:hypothetical protein n=1 Tax=Streptomyces sp. NPDC096538 TaxID=3155427 RepID=UPI00332E8FE2